MITIKKHHLEHLDGTRGAWRPTLIGGVLSSDGEHHASFNEVVVFSCPLCGLQQGVGGDDIKVQPDGTTTEPVKCHHKGCTFRDVLKFDKHDQPEGREHFAKLQAEAHKGVADARVRKVHDIIKRNMEAELHERSLAEAKKIFPVGGTNHNELFKQFMDEQKRKAGAN